MTTNYASIALHKKLDFETDNYEYTNKKANKIYCFVKLLT